MYCLLWQGRFPWKIHLTVLYKGPKSGTGKWVVAMDTKVCRKQRLLTPLGTDFGIGSIILVLFSFPFDRIVPSPNGDAPAAFYIVGTADGSRPGKFFVNVHKVDAQ